MENIEDGDELGIHLKLTGEAVNAFSVYRTRLIKEDGTNPSKEEVVRFALRLLDLLMDSSTQKKDGQRTYLAIVTEKKGEVSSCGEIILKGLRIANVLF